MDKFRRVNLNQSGSEWLDWRSGKINGDGSINEAPLLTLTASVISSVMDANPYESAWKLYQQMKGFIEKADISKNPAVRHGNKYEPIARMHMRNYLRENIEVFCAESIEYPWLRVSFDGVTTSSRVPVEIKCPTANTWKDVLKNGKNSTAFKMYSIQAHAQMMCLGAEYGWLVFYNAGTEKLLPIRIEKDEGLQRKIAEKCEKFLADFEKGIEPVRVAGTDPYAPVRDAEIALWDRLTVQIALDMKRKERLSSEIKEVDARIKSSMAEMRQTMDEDFSTSEFRGLRISEVNRAPSVDLKRFVSDLNLTVGEEYFRESKSYLKPSLFGKNKEGQKITADDISIGNTSDFDESKTKPHNLF